MQEYRWSIGSGKRTYSDSQKDEEYDEEDYSSPKKCKKDENYERAKS